SLYSYVPEQQDVKLPEIRKLGEIASEKTTRFFEGEEAAHIENLKRWAQVTPFTVKDLPPPLIQQYTAVNGHHGSFLFIFPAIDLWHGRDVIRFSNEILEFKEKTKGYDIHVASEALIYSDIFSLVKKEGPWALAASIAAVFLLIWIFAKRVRSVLLVFSPLISGVICLVGIMYLFGIQFNFMNSIIFPILIGLGIDNGIHIYHRYREAGPGSLRFVLQKTGSAIFLSSTTTMLGFGALLIAFHKGLQSIGLLAVIGMGICFLTSITVLPALLQLLEDRDKS
ncbi:MAG: MMPL family transporter, partial [Deltaproteobacteria bacterium]